MDFKKNIKEIVKTELDIDESLIERSLETCELEYRGDFSLACQKLLTSKTSNPTVIAKELSNKIRSSIFEKVVSEGPYINFYVNKKIYIESVIDEINFNNITFKKKEEKKSVYIDMDEVIHEKKLKFIANSFYRLFCLAGYKVICSEGIKNKELLNINGIINSFKDKKLLVGYEKNKLVSLERYNLAPLILIKSDGTISREALKLNSLLQNNKKINCNNIIVFDEIVKKTQYKKIIIAAEATDTSLKDKICFIGLRGDERIILFDDFQRIYVKRVYEELLNIIQLSNNVFIDSMENYKDLKIQHKLAKKLSSFNIKINSSICNYDLNIFAKYILELIISIDSYCQLICIEMKEVSKINIIDKEMLIAIKKVIESSLFIVE